MVVTEERKKFALYSKEGEDYTNIEQLKGKILAIVKGFFFEEVLGKYYLEINLLLTNNTLDAMKQGGQIHPYKVIPLSTIIR